MIALAAQIGLTAALYASTVPRILVLILPAGIFIAVESVVLARRWSFSVPTFVVAVLLAAAGMYVGMVAGLNVWGS